MLLFAIAAGRKLLRAIQSRPKIIIEMSRCEKVRAIVASGLLATLVFALGLAASPQLHARFHPDAGSPNHECAVTLIASGKYEQADAPPALLSRRSPQLFSRKFRRSHPSGYAAPFLGASHLRARAARALLALRPAACFARSGRIPSPTGNRRRLAHALVR